MAYDLCERTFQFDMVLPLTAEHMKWKGIEFSNKILVTGSRNCYQARAEHLLVPFLISRHGL